MVKGGLNHGAECNLRLPIIPQRLDLSTEGRGTEQQTRTLTQRVLSRTRDLIRGHGERDHAKHDGGGGPIRELTTRILRCHPSPPTVTHHPIGLLGSVEHPPRDTIASLSRWDPLSTLSTPSGDSSWCRSQPLSHRLQSPPLTPSPAPLIASPHRLKFCDRAETVLNFFVPARRSPTLTNRKMHRLERREPAWAASKNRPTRN
jgi:hypothetical protein